MALPEWLTEEYEQLFGGELVPKKDTFQPSPGWGKVCESCTHHQVRKLDPNFPCVYSRVSPFYPSLERFQDGSEYCAEKEIVR
jgi:hypothetical protein